MQSSRRYGFGFTLIELLVVIAVIGVLIGILLPVLSRSIAAGKRVACGSNLRSMHTALTMYMDAGDGFLPYAEFPADFTRGFVAPYDELAGHLDAELSLPVGGGFARTQPWVCPSDYSIFKKIGTSYFYNPYPLFGATPAGERPRGWVTRVFYDNTEHIFKDPVLFQDVRPFHGKGQPGKNGVRPDGSVIRLPPREF